MSTEELPPRESMEFDVVIVGAGPSGLAAAIRLKQLNAQLTIVVVEKGSEVCAHILSGAVIDPVSLDKLIPDWREDADCPLKTQVKTDKFYWMTAGTAIPLPNIMMPPLMNNHHCYIGSLGNVCRWLARKAEALGVEIYPGFAATEVLYDEKGAVRGIATGDMGVARDGSHKSSYTRGMELLGKYTLFAEGARGSLTKQLIAKFALDANSQPPKFGIGLKEVWQIDPAKHQKGLIQHSFGWPLNNSTGGGSFLYHYDDNLVAVGFVVHLNYDDPYLSPFDEFQRYKTHPSVRNLKALWSKFGTIIGVALGGIDMWCNTLGFSLFGTQSHAKPDSKTLDPAKAHAPIAPPKPDGKLTFDRLSSVFLSNTNHEENQPVHLKVADMNLQKTSEHGVYAGPSNRYCPAGVYEWVEDTPGPAFQINAQNCVHCKTCDVKDPNGNITWVPPEGGGGPNYEAM